VIGHPVVVGTKTDDVSWYILSSFDSWLDAMLRDVKREIAVRDLAVIWY